MEEIPVRRRTEALDHEVLQAAEVGHSSENARPMASRDLASTATGTEVLHAYAGEGPDEGLGLSQSEEGSEVSYGAQVTILQDELSGLGKQKAEEHFDR